MDKKGLTANALAEKEAGVNVNTLASCQLPAASFGAEQEERARASALPALS